MQWNFTHENTDFEKVLHLARELNVDKSIAHILLNRKISSFDLAKSFFRPTWDALHDPFRMKGMDKAVQRLIKAIENQELIMLFGDYDVDGTTSVSLTYSVLQKHLSNMEVYIPDRYLEGYGLSYQAIEHASKIGVKLMLVLDCGTKDVDKINFAKSQGIDMVVCDHHTPDQELPTPYALLNPKQIDCTYPFKELSACGVAFKFMQALYLYNKWNVEDLKQVTDLLAASIACDIVPIIGENRILAVEGLKKLNTNPNKALATLFEKAQKAHKVKNISDLVFTIGPRINAAGRVDHGKKIVRFLTSQDETLLDQLSHEINKNNEDRRLLDQNTTQEALQILEKDPLTSQKSSNVVHQAHWHKGVVGIVASRIIEKYYKPTIVLTQSQGKWMGSARSVRGFNVYQALLQCQDLLEQFGGHMYAAGLTLKEENLNAFKIRFEEVVAQTIHSSAKYPSLDIDLEMNFSELNPKFFRILTQLEPFGPENPKPLFVSRNLIDTGSTRLVGQDNKHLKLSICHLDQPSIVFKGIGFQMAEYFQDIKNKRPFDLAYTIEENQWQGNISYELSVKDLQWTDI